MPFLTGSEEERGPLFDITREHFEGRAQPDRRRARTGDKLGVPGIPGDVPDGGAAAGRAHRRPADRLRARARGPRRSARGSRAAVGAAVAGSGIERVVVSGLANEFVLYFTTPEEYDRQHYEGGNTHFGRSSSVLVQQELATLAGRLVRGEPAPAPYPFDPTNGVAPDGPPYASGRRARARVLEQPAGGGTAASAARRSPGRAARRASTGPWTARSSPPSGGPAARAGGPRLAQRPRRPRPGDAVEGRRRGPLPRGLGDSRYAPRGPYRFVVTAKRYRLTSRTFRLGTSDALAARPDGPGAVRLLYPGAVKDLDITSRPPAPDGGAVRVRVGSARDPRRPSATARCSASRPPPELPCRSSRRATATTTPSARREAPRTGRGRHARPRPGRRRRARGPRRSGLDARRARHHRRRAPSRRRVRAAGPDWVANCAAFTRVDGAEAGARRGAARERRRRAHGGRGAAEAAGATVLYPSTDYVFDGTKDAPATWSPTSRRAAVELRPLQARRRGGDLRGNRPLRGAHLVAVRHSAGATSWRRCSGWPSAATGAWWCDDQVGAPTYTGHLAEGLVRLMDTDARGLHHMAAGGECSWREFAVAIFERSRRGLRVRAATTAEFGRPAPRPRYSVLGTSSHDAIHLPDWRQGLRGYLRGAPA